MIRRTLAALAVLSAALAGCGGHGGTRTATTTTTPPAPVQRLQRAHPCPSSPTAPGYYMQCRATAPGITHQTLPGGSAAKFGIDFAWGGPACQTARAYGASFGASYLSDSSKDWTPGLIASYRNNGCGIVFVWESSAARSLAGFNAGYDDAFNATHEAARLGYPHAHIDYASDYDTSNYGRAFEPYYEGAAAWDRRAGATTGAYGGLHTVAQLCADHITTLNWQTIAWSYGQWASTACAPLRQTAIDLNWHGYSADYNFALAANYGQANYTPPVPPLRCFGAHGTPKAAKCKPIVADVARWQRAVTASTGAYRARGCPALIARRDDLTQRWDWFWLRLHNHPKFKTASRRRALQSTGRALNSTRRVVSGRQCVIFGARARYYGALITSTEKRYS